MPLSFVPNEIPETVQNHRLNEVEHLSQLVTIQSLVQSRIFLSKFRLMFRKLPNIYVSILGSHKAWSILENLRNYQLIKEAYWRFTETLLQSREVGLEVHTKKTDCIVLFRHQSAAQDHNLTTAGD